LTYRVTFRQEVFIDADSEEEAQELWHRLDLGALDLELCKGNRPGGGSAIFREHNFVEAYDLEEYE